MSNPASITPVILSGGSGTRLWPLSRSARPKQFLDFAGDGTMLEQTLARTAGQAGYGAPLIVCGATHACLIPEDGLGKNATLILEPCARNTAPAIALAASALPQEALMLVMPSDHVIANQKAFLDAVAAAAPLAQAGWFITFGVMPTGPETGYGYIRRGESIAEGIFRVDRFVEKPDSATAQGYLDAGGYSWNAGIFLFSAGAYLGTLERFAPDMAQSARAAMGQAAREGRQIMPDADAFAASPSDSIDYAVMEKADKVAVVPVDMGWSDIGSWDALHDLLGKDAHNNAHVGEIVNVDGSGNLVFSDGPLVTVSGVSDLLVIATGDAVMILPRGSSQDVKKIVEQLKARQHPSL
ncbi:MAG: mannose-1-phosphate guanylyltransferase/mannose-6-phosphate isomerase [Sphingobium sp.]|jgi:mannose-1-phosphate guanylyltransferase|nr:mannose-1-phosphate guanylyltransferase/mannose-6-phosphate isomerase [Sphingobium sp.]MCI1270255.1 mannose-1-phosphate guanylyltransferase/mannose-6-phosphate isomerase [Sphingobium sp.]MCI1754523.1 mannose-1-phosphate guanylyltransferase/mannose-6-phosphate isomerase [Sphingobium sp.]MCI2051961.1 mannose-1-phosphate guanylyltransferase/mannose-6-phosphate isomerase [Sphingobium sp.]